MKKQEIRDIMQEKFGLPYEAKTAGNLMSVARSVDDRHVLVAATLNMDLGFLGSVFYGFHRRDEAEAVARKARRNRTIPVVCVDVIGSEITTF